MPLACHQRGGKDGERQYGWWDGETLLVGTEYPGQGDGALLFGAVGKAVRLFSTKKGLFCFFLHLNPSKPFQVFL